jgi:CRP-like cAMP-binding protein
VELEGYFNYPEVKADPSDAPFLATCSQDEWATIRAHADTLRYAAGSTVIAPGSLERALVILVTGQLEVVRTHAGRRRDQRLALCEAGSVVGELAFLDGKPASALVRAVGEVEVLRLPLPRFEVLAAKDPQLALYVLFDLGRLVASRFRTAQLLLGTVDR